MGKTFVSNYSNVSNKILKSNRKTRIRKNANKLNSEKVQHKRQHSGKTENELPRKKQKIVNESGAEKKVNLNVNTEIDEVDTIVLKNGNFCYLHPKDSYKGDLFLDDELKTTYFKNILQDIYFNIIEEISLEGLDGITTEALWKRMSYTEFPLPINNNTKEIVWKIIIQNNNFNFYELVEPRGELKIFNHLQHFDSEGVILEMFPQEQELYPVEVLNIPNIQGSCSTYYSRTDISEVIRQKSCQEVEKEYGRKLVIVANQNARRAMLMDDADPLLELQNVEYCILERIGRARKLGVLTQGNMSLANQFKMDSKSVFHYKKHMIRHGLIEKQFFYIRSQTTEQNKTGRLLHLKRFYNKIKPKYLLFLEQIVNILKAQPSYRMPSVQLKKHFKEFEQAVKITKSSGFRKFIKHDCIYSYRTIYPNATKSEYMKKNFEKGEKGIRCYELIDPYINVVANYKNEDDVDSDDDDDPEEGDEEVGGNKIYNMELFREIYLHILSKGKDGCARIDISRLVGVDRNSIRMVLKKLVSKNVVHIRRVDVGKQRMLTYYAKYLDHDEESVIINSIPMTTVSTVKEKMKQRQKAAIERHKESKSDDTTSTIINATPKLDKKKTNQDMEIVKCEYFINNNVVPEQLSDEIIIDVSSLISKKMFPLQLLRCTIPGCDSINVNINLQVSQINLLSLKTFSNFPTIYFTTTRNIDYITKLILLKATFDEIKIQHIDSFTRKRKISGSAVVVAQDDERNEKKLDKLQFMGTEPVTVYSSTENHIDVKLIVSTPPKKYNYEVVYQQPNDMSQRVASRIQIVLDAVNEKKVYEDLFRLLRLIMSKESQAGYQKKIDRKSLSRILKKLVTDGFIRIYHLIVSDERLTKTQFFICHPTITYTDSTFETALQQLKFRFFNRKKGNNSDAAAKQPSIKYEQAAGSSPFKELDVMESITQLHAMRPDTQVRAPPSLKFVRSVAKIRGLKPKFIRMRIFHELLFFLIYDYSSSGEALTPVEVSKLFKSHYINLSEEDIQSMPEIYFKELSWKMFIPPLPHHKGWSTGWALMCDVILRMPISVFCKVHSVGVKSPELEELLNHPIKRFYLLKDIPDSVRKAIFFKRKYLTSIFDSLNKLAFCGLLQMGPQKYKEKDQSFIYLNRKASLLDTKTSEPGYNKISKQEYPKLKFYFNSVNEIDQYWYQMYFISLNTKLNQRTAGLLVTYTDISAKPGLMEALKCRSDAEAALKDTGHLPGDNRGAAGLDSCLWVHIAKNWFWAKVKRKEIKTPAVLGLEREKMSKITTAPISFKDLHVKSNSNKIYLLNALRGEDSSSKKEQMLVNIPTKTSKKCQRFVKRIHPRKALSKRQYYDQVDRIIVKKNGPNMKVKWNNREDHCLMLCKLGDLFLNPNNVNRRPIYYNVIRDVLHRICPQTKNKTSRACQRRIKIILRDKYHHLEEEVINLLKVDEISKYFLPFLTWISNKKSDGNKMTDKECTNAYIILMNYIFKHEKELEDILKGNMIDHLSSKNLSYTENNLMENPSSLKFADPVNEDDIQKDVLKTVIHSTLTSRNQPDWALQLFKIYQRYHDNLIKSAVEELKSTQTISCRKSDVRKNRISWQIPFKLSQSYIYFQFTTFNQVTALEAFKTFLSLKDNVINNRLDFSKEVVESKKYGQLLGISEFFTFWDQIRFNIKLPQYMVILNPDIEDHSELVHTLAVRLRHRLKKNVQESKADEEQDEQDLTMDQLSSRDEEFIVNKPANLSQNIDSTDSEPINDNQSNPLDLAADLGNTETIDQLKNWISDCMERDRSPSPDFIKPQEKNIEVDETDHIQNVHSNEPVSQTPEGKIYPPGYIPTLDEIKEDMLRPPIPNEDRIVPHITELSDLLNRESLTELDTDEEALEQLKSHFITQYPKLETLSVEEQDCLKQFYFIDYIQAHSKNEQIWKKVQSEMVIEDAPGCEENRLSQLILEQDGTHEDLLLSNQIVQYVCQKEVVGATGMELKEQFSKEEKTIAITTIIQILIDMKLIIRVGICTLRFVHYKYQLTWLVETFYLTNEEHANIKCLENQVESFEKQLNQTKLIRVKVAPWTQINGTINYQTLNSWLNSVLSHCLEYPKIPFMKLCEKFCYLKPVDVFILLETLQELGCVDMVFSEPTKQSLFSSWEPPKHRNATFLDDFKNIFVEVNNISMTLLGSFFYDSLNKWDTMRTGSKNSDIA